MRCAIYRRVSTDMQVEEGVSLDTQLERLESFALSQNWTVVKDYCDEGYSAKNTNRPHFQQMMNDLKNGMFDVILVYRLDRFTRSVSDLSNLLQVLDKYNVKFKSSTETFDTTSATGRMFITLVATLAQWERETISERVYDNMKSRAEKGVHQGKSPYGYDKDEKGNLIVNEEEAEIVKYVFQSYLSRGMTSIVKDLNRKGIRTKLGNPQNYESVKYILHNHIYIGKIKWDEVISDIAQENFEPLIPLELWNNVQKTIATRKHKPVRTQRYFAFSGVVKCGRCGSYLMGREDNRGSYSTRSYTCKHRRHLGLCDLPLIPEYVIEEAFLKMIKAEYMKQIQVKKDTSQPALSRETLQKQLNSIAAKKDRLKILFVDIGDMTKDEYKTKLQELSKEELELYQQINAIEEDSTLGEITDTLQRLLNEWEYLEDEHKKAVINSLFEGIVVDVTKRGRAGQNPIAPTIEILDVKLK